MAYFLLSLWKIGGACGQKVKCKFGFLHSVSAIVLIDKVTKMNNE